MVVIPAQAGIQDFPWWVLDSRFHGNDPINFFLKRQGVTEYSIFEIWI
jgi:hypothetical protein